MNDRTRVRRIRKLISSYGNPPMTSAFELSGHYEELIKRINSVLNIPKGVKTASLLDEVPGWDKYKKV